MSTWHQLRLLSAPCEGLSLHGGASLSWPPASGAPTSLGPLVRGGITVVTAVTGWRETWPMLAAPGPDGQAGLWEREAPTFSPLDPGWPCKKAEGTFTVRPAGPLVLVEDRRNP